MPGPPVLFLFIQRNKFFSDRFNIIRDMFLHRVHERLCLFRHGKVK